MVQGRRKPKPPSTAVSNKMGEAMSPPNQAAARRARGRIRPARGAAQRPRDEPPGQPGLVSRQIKHSAGRVGSIELLGGRLVPKQKYPRAESPGLNEPKGSMGAIRE